MNSKDLRAMVNELGIDRGRVMAEFPRSWKRELFARARNELSELDQVLFQNYIEALVLDAGKLCRLGLDFDRSLDWLANARRLSKEFDGVIVSDCDIEEDGFECVSKLGLAGSVWRVATSGEFERSAEGIAHALSPFLNLGRSVILMDPHFDPANRNFRLGLAAIIGSIETEPTLFEVHTATKDYNADNPSDITRWKSTCEMILPDLFPTGWTVHVGWWERKRKGRVRRRPHQRFILNELGGVGLDYGFQTSTGDLSKYYLLGYEEAIKARTQISLEPDARDGELAYSLVSKLALSGTG